MSAPAALCERFGRRPREQATAAAAQLPDEALERIFVLLPLRAWRCARLACRDWARAALVGVTRLEATGCQAHTSTGLAKALGQVPKLASLALHGALPPATLAGLSTLSALSALRMLRLDLVEVSGQHVAALAHLPHLTQLDLRCYKVLGAGQGTPPAAVRQLSVLSGLASLRLEAQGLAQEEHNTELAALSALTRLTRLHLGLLSLQERPSTWAMRKCMAALGRMHTLRALTVAGRVGGTQFSPPLLAGLTGLTRLRLGRCATFSIGSDAGALRAMAQLMHLQLVDHDVTLRDVLELLMDTSTALTRLDFFGFECIGAEASLARLSALPGLAALSVCGAECAGGALGALAELTRLTELSIRDIHFRAPGAQFYRLAGLTALARLQLGPDDTSCWNYRSLSPAEPRLGASGFPALTALDLGDFVFNSNVAALAGGPLGPRLQDLRLGMRCLSDRGLSALSALCALTRLHLDGTRPPAPSAAPDKRVCRASGVVCEGLASLSQVPCLRELHLQRFRWECAAASAADALGLAETTLALSALRRVTSLTRLTLSWWQSVSEAALVHFAAFPTLELLEVLHTNVVAAGGLRAFNGTGCRVVTQAFVEAEEDLD